MIESLGSGSGSDFEAVHSGSGVDADILGRISRPFSIIVGGNDTEKGEFKFMASLRSGNDSHFCGGSILDASHILTACHCCSPPPPKYVSVGKYHVDAKEEGESHDVEKIFIHENRDCIKNDICVIKVSMA